MNLVQKLAIAYILGAALLAFGFAVGKYEVFPYSYIQKIEEYIAWNPDAKKTTLQEKLKNELGVAPIIFTYPSTIPTATVDQSSELPVPQLHERRENPKIYVAPEHQSGYRAIFGAIDFDDTFWGGILLDPESKVVHTWKLSTDHLPKSTRPDLLKNMYGLALLPDGSVIYTMGEDGGGIVKVDACGEVLWNLEGLFHHTISMSENNEYFWSWEGVHTATYPKLIKASSKTGEIVETIDMKDVMLQNEFIHIFNARKHAKTNGDIFDVSHANDIDELSDSQAQQFPDFNAGDLLLSYRNLNLIFVLDPDTLDIKWWRAGATDHQHDADWENGAITSFSNNMTGARKGHSDIVRIDVDTGKPSTVVDGKDHSIFSIINARQNTTEFDTRIITSSTQGWALEVDENDTLVFSFINTYDNEMGTLLHLSEAYRVKPSYFTHEFWEDCGS
tara:strand:- start:217 stop:1554 length:1338 start_codon:yes stop_codon:yes gene_type:complete